MDIFVNILGHIFYALSNLAPWLYIAFFPACYFCYEKGIEEGQRRGYKNIYYDAGTRNHPKDISVCYLRDSQVKCFFDLSSHTLYIEGSGPMDDMEYYPWWGCASSISSIYIEPGITHIGMRAFRGCNCRSVFIPASVESIGYHAFEYMPSLYQVVLESRSTTFDRPFEPPFVQEPITPKIVYKDEL